MGKTRRERIRDFFSRDRFYRYNVILIMCILGLGGFICFDSLGSLEENVMTFMDLSASEFSLMYSVNAWPNSVLCFFCGFLIDRFFGIKLGTIFYSVVVTVGHLIFSLGVFLGIFWLSLMGRFIFGIGVEVMFICLQCYVIVWFKEKELSMVISIINSVPRLGTSVMYELATPLYKVLARYVEGLQAVGIVFFITGITTFVSIGFGFILKNMDPNKYKKISETEDNNGGGTQGDTQKKITIKDVTHFPITFWFIVIGYTSFVSTIFVIIPFTQGFFMTHFNLPVETANNVTSFFSILSAVIAPFLGIIVDRVGRTSIFLILGMCNILVAHLLLTIGDISPFAGMFFMSTGMALLISSTSPMLSFIIPVHHLGTAFGVTTAMASIAYSVNLIIAGALVDKYSFIAMELYMIAWSIIGLVTSVLLWIIDRKATGVFNKSTAQRQQFEQTQSQKNEAKEPLNA